MKFYDRGLPGSTRCANPQHMLMTPESAKLMADMTTNICVSHHTDEVALIPKRTKPVSRVNKPSDHHQCFHPKDNIILPIHQQT